MGQIQEIGHRIELVSMDAHFHEITIALYRQIRDQVPVYLVHSYSQKDGTTDRLAFVVAAMQVLGGMEKTDDGLLYFSCGSAHPLGVRRVFLEACKLDPTASLVARPLTIEDRKSGLTIPVLNQGQGVYRVTAEGEGSDGDRRIAIIVNGLMKLGEMASVTEASDQVSFECQTDHDALVGLLLVRAPNVRAIIREEEQIASRGVLAAPSAQKV